MVAECDVLKDTGLCSLSGASGGSGCCRGAEPGARGARCPLQEGRRACEAGRHRFPGAGGQRPLTFYVSLVDPDFMCNEIWERKLRSGPFRLLTCDLNTAKKRCHKLIF